MRMLYEPFDQSLLAELQVLVIPSGIGEFQWMWTKMSNVPKKFAVLALDGAPRRLHQFAELHPNVDTFAYVGWEYSQIRQFQAFHELFSWEAIEKKFGAGQPCFLACNPALEAGTHISQWLPDLPTRYSYTVSYQTEHERQAKNLLHDVTPQDILIGISCASYRGAAGWRTWEAKEWIEFLSKILVRVPEVKFVFLGGSWDDLTSSVAEAFEGRVQTDLKGRVPVGTMQFGGAMRTLEKLHGYIGFSSGLGHVAAHLCGTPVAMLWPKHEIEKLSTSWVDPQLLESGKYIPSGWDDPETVFNRFKPWLDKWVLKGR